MLVICSPLLKRRCSINPPTSNITGTLESLPIREGSGNSNPQRRHCCCRRRAAVLPRAPRRFRAADRPFAVVLRMAEVACLHAPRKLPPQALRSWVPWCSDGAGQSNVKLIFRHFRARLRCD